MKKIVVGSVIAMAAGAGMMAYALNNKNTKHFDQKIKERSTDCHCSHERCKAD